MTTAFAIVAWASALLCAYEPLECQAPTELLVMFRTSNKLLSMFQTILRILGLGPLPLTTRTEERLNALFVGQDRARAKQILLWLPSRCSKHPEEAERIRFALLRLSNGSVSELDNWMNVLRNDFRDVLMASGFGDDARAHESWFPKGPGLEGRPPLAERGDEVAGDLKRLKHARAEARKRFGEA